MTTSMKNELRTDGVITTELNGRQRRALKKAQRAEQAKADAERAEQIAAETAENASEEEAVQAANAAIQAEADAETAETEANETEATVDPEAELGEPTTNFPVITSGRFGVRRKSDLPETEKSKAIFAAMREMGAIGIVHGKTAKQIAAKAGVDKPMWVRHYCYHARKSGKCGVDIRSGAYHFYLIK